MTKDQLDNMPPCETPHFETPPEGWIRLEGAATAPQGYEWWTNGQSRFSAGYESALVRSGNDQDS